MAWLVAAVSDGCARRPGEVVLVSVGGIITFGGERSPHEYTGVY